MVAEEVRHADAVVLTYACDRPETLERLITYWLPELRRLEVCFSSLFFQFCYVNHIHITVLVLEGVKFLL